MKKRSKPRYLVPEKRKRQPKGRAPSLIPESAGRGWFRMVARFVVLSTAIPYLLFRVVVLAASPYRIHFDARPRAVKLDGRAIRLDSADGFDLSRFALGEHRLRYLDAAGATRTVIVRPRLDDDDGGLTIAEGRLSGVPRAAFAPTPDQGR